MKTKKEKNNSTSSSWLVIFADLLALVLAFFVLTYSFSNPNNFEFYAISNSLSQKFLSKEIVPHTTINASIKAANTTSPSKEEDFYFVYSAFQQKLSHIIRQDKVLSATGYNIYYENERIIIELPYLQQGEFPNDNLQKFTKNLLGVLSLADNVKKITLIKKIEVFFQNFGKAQQSLNEHLEELSLYSNMVKNAKIAKEVAFFINFVPILKKENNFSIITKSFNKTSNGRQETSNNISNQTPDKTPKKSIRQSLKKNSNHILKFEIEF